MPTGGYESPASRLALRRGLSANHQMLAIVPSTPTAAATGFTTLRPLLSAMCETLPCRLGPQAAPAHATAAFAAPASGAAGTRPDAPGPVAGRFHHVHVDVHVPRFTWPGGPAAIGPTLLDTARTAEAIGVRTLSVMDQ